MKTETQNTINILSKTVGQIQTSSDMKNLLCQLGAEQIDEMKIFQHTLEDWDEEESESYADWDDEKSKPETEDYTDYISRQLFLAMEKKDRHQSLLMFVTSRLYGMNCNPLTDLALVKANKELIRMVSEVIGNLANFGRMTD